MSINNPDILYLLLEDLSKKVNDLNHYVSIVIDDADALKNVTINQFGQAVFDTNHISSLITTYKEDVSYWNKEADGMFIKVESLTSSIINTQKRLQLLLDNCNRSYNYWQEKLAVAKTNLQKWKGYWAEAINQMIYAENRYNNARMDYETARSQYNACMNARDSQGRSVKRNCSGYVVQMNAAQVAMSQAEAERKGWEQEKIKAEREIFFWEQRIDACIESIDILKQAIVKTNSGLKLTSNAAMYNARCLQEIQAATSLIKKAEAVNTNQEELFNKNDFSISKCQSYIDVIINVFIKANNLSNQVQFYGSISTEKINNKVDDLIAFSKSSNYHNEI